VAHEFDNVEPALAADDAPALEVAPAADDATEIIESDTLSVAEPMGSDTALPIHLAPTANDAPELDIVQTADSTSDVVQSDALRVADPIDPETTVSQDLDAAEHTDLAEPIAVHPGDVQAGEHDAVETAPQDEPAPQLHIEDVYLDDFMTTKIDEPAPQQNDLGAQSASLDLTDLLILDFETPSAPGEPPPGEALREEDAHADTFEAAPRAGAETIASATAEEPVIEPYRPAEAETPRAPAEPPARTEIRSSLFARLFQSIRRQSAEPIVEPRMADQPAQDSSPSKTEDAPATTAPFIDESTNTALPKQKEFKLENVSDATIAPAVPWLADLASPAAGGETAEPDELSLEPIAWPAPKRPADDHIGTPDAAGAVDVAQRAETAAGEAPDASSDAAPSDATTFDFEPVHTAEHEQPTGDAVAVSQPIEDVSFNAKPDDTADVDTVQAAESTVDVVDLQPKLESAPDHVRPEDVESIDVAPDSAPSEPITAVADEEHHPTDDATAAAPDAIESAPLQADEFSSKADRLAYLLAKLEGAIQAKATAEAVSHKEDVETAPREPDQSAEPAQSAEPSDPEPRAVEAAAVAHVEPATPATPEPDAQTRAPEENAALIVEAQAVEAPAYAVETPEITFEAPAAAVEPNDAPSDTTAQAQKPDVAGPAVEQPLSDDRPEDADSVPLKPDRLSYLLTKLFESAIRQSPEPAAKPQDATASEAPAASDFPADEEHADDILDLSLPDTDRAEPDDVHEIEFGTLSEEPAELQAAVEHQSHVEAPTPPELPVIEVAPPVDTVSDVVSENAERSGPKAPATSAPPSEAPPTEPAARPRLAEPAPLFGTKRPRRPRPAAAAPQAEVKPATEAAPTPAIELKPAVPAPERTPEPARNDAPAGVPRRDWKLSANGARGEHPNTEGNGDTPGAAKKSEPTLRLKTGSGALATVDAPPPGTPAAAEKTPAKYYGPKHAQGDDDETGAASPAQQRALSLADALTEYYAKAGQLQPPMHTTDRATLQRIIANGKLEAPRRRGAPWSISGMSRRGEVAIRLKPGAEQFIEFVPSTEIFGQVPHYYPRGVGKGSYATHIPAGHLEHFDLATRQWAPVQRG